MMSSTWRDALRAKTALLFTTHVDREAAGAVLAPVLSGVEGDRVAVACLKLSGGDLVKLEECVRAALTDYRDILAWAEAPRQMRLGASAAPDKQSIARRADAEEYARWLSSFDGGDA
jgi:hypothetical protein